MNRKATLGILGALTLLAPAALAADGGGEDSPSLQQDVIPNIMIVRVPATGDAASIEDQRTDTDVDVFPLTVTVRRQSDGTVDLQDLRGQVLDLMQTTQPVTVSIKTPEQTFAEIPSEVQQKFSEAEEDSVASQSADKAVVAWRGYGPVRGYHAGVVAFNRAPYRGYYPYYVGKSEEALYGLNPYFGYYANYRNYPFTYGVYRSTPSYHYFGYYRYY
jgi:hypothetical protein